jgi:hypothetical protein
MYILNLLKSLNSDLTETRDVVSFEYRLLCSGELYNAQNVTYDWRKSDVSRLLVHKPFTLTVCSHPFDDYPQELSLRFQVASVTETKGITTSTFYPDEEIARDIAAILSLLLRRLITVAGKIREIHPRVYEKQPDASCDIAIDCVNKISRNYWDRKPASIIYGSEGIHEIIDYNPPPLALIPHDLQKLLMALAASHHAESLVLSARLYSQALRQIEQEADLAYQSLISCVETIANKSLSEYQPEEDKMIEIKKTVYNMAAKFGLEQDNCKALAIEACSGMTWATKKFTKFLMDNAGEDLLKKDDLFHLDELFFPKQDEFESAINAIYAARGGATHRGRPYPASISIGVGPTFSSSAFHDLNLGQPNTPITPIPPIIWFERLVNSAINNFIKKTHVE